ncbi:MAG: MlaD family protein [Planctomycetes bacterium]|nr:MlaD family protein [Planctomycetota bacterium]
MTAPANRWKLGLFVVAGCAATITGLTWIGMHELKREFHVAYAYFDEALTGLEEGSPVKFRGVTIGVVQRIRVAEDKKHLQVQAALYDDYLRDLGLDVSTQDGVCPLPDNLRAQVVMSWVTSTSFIQVDFFPDPELGPQRLPFAVPAGQSTLRTVPSTAKSLEVAAREVLRDLPSMAMSARELVELLRTELQAARLPELTRQLQAVLQRSDQLLADLQQRDLAGEAVRTLAAVRDGAASLRDEHGPLGSALAELRGLAQSLRQELAAAEVGATAAGVRQGAAAIAALGDGMRGELSQLRATLSAVERLAALLERDPGALLRGRSPQPSPLENNRR